MEVTPRSLVLDLLSTLGRGSAPVSALVEAGLRFGIRENSLRVALARLLAAGRVERDGRGAYAIGDAARAMNREIRSWRRLESQLVRWRGDWLGVHTAALPARTARQRRLRDRALRFLAFRPLNAGLLVRPANLRGGAQGVRERLAALGLEAPGLIFRIDDLDEVSDRRARSLWDGAAIVAGYRATREALAESEARLADLPRNEAMVESFRVGGAALRQLILDPVLPEPIVPAAERRALIEAARHYDALGRAMWAGWLGNDDSRPEHGPVGVRGPRRGSDLFTSTGGA